MFKKDRLNLFTQTLKNTADHFLLEDYKLVPCLFFDKNTGLQTITNQSLNIIDKRAQYNDDNHFFQDYHLCLPLILFHCAFDRVHEQVLMLVWTLFNRL